MTSKPIAESERLEMLEAILRHRNWQNQHWPIGLSLIGFDVFIHIAIRSLERQFAPLKSLYAALPYSEPAIRKYLKRLIKQGFVLEHQSPEDRRSRSFSLSPKAIQVIDAYFEIREDKHRPQAGRGTATAAETSAPPLSRAKKTRSPPLIPGMQTTEET